MTQEIYEICQTTMLHSPSRQRTTHCEATIKFEGEIKSLFDTDHEVIKISYTIPTLSISIALTVNFPTSKPNFRSVPSSLHFSHVKIQFQLQGRRPSWIDYSRHFYWKFLWLCCDGWMNGIIRASHDPDCVDFRFELNRRDRKCWQGHRDHEFRDWDCRTVTNSSSRSRVQQSNRLQGSSID